MKEKKEKPIKLQKMSLWPGDYTQFRTGLRVENVGRRVLEFDISEKIYSYPVNKKDIED